MKRRIVHRSINRSASSVRRTPIPMARHSAGGGFFSLIGRLDAASARLNAARTHRR